MYLMRLSVGAERGRFHCLGRAGPLQRGERCKDLNGAET